MSSEVRYAVHGEVSIAYEAFGSPDDGEPMVLVMGLNSQMVWWPEAFCDLLVDHGYAVVRFDNRDVGLSSRVHSPYGLRDLAADTLAVMDGVGWHSAHLLGVSLGAAIVQATAVLHPDRVRSLTSCLGMPATTGQVRTLKYLRPGILPTLRRLSPSDDPEREIDNLVAIHRALASPGYPFPQEWARQVAQIAHRRSPRDPEAMRRQDAARRRPGLPPLSRITAPTLVISGADDPLIRACGGRDTARQIPGARFVSYPRMGHTLPEQLWPKIVAELGAVTRPATGTR